jgi:ADP-heptose:LPS heptosyltransferase/predicted SAM-dependent methyltransferase
MVWTADGPQGRESAKIVWEVAPYLRGTGLDLGAGPYRVLPHAITVDNGHHAQAFGQNFRPDVHVETCEKMQVFASASMDFVFSSHLLEHIENYKAALIEWFRLIKLGGYLVLYLPHKDFYPNIGQPGSNPDHKHDFLPSDIVDAMLECKGWDLIEKQDRNEVTEYSMLLIFQKVQGRGHEFSCDMTKPTKTALVCRFGAFGDLMQSSSVWAGLKNQGYHITLMTSRPGCDIVTEDPNIDKMMILDKDQVPNAHLSDFWAWQAKKYDKLVNLSESVEGTYLAMPGRVQSAWWNPTVRHRMMNYNYVEHQHEMAGVPHDPVIKFYNTKEEKAWARAQRARMGKFVVLWSLAGSSVHKTWAGLDAIIAALMLNYKDVHVVLCGGPEAVMLEAGWEKEPRVTLTSGRWTIRQTLSFMKEADLVIGPETGVLNAAANEQMAKMVFLSHSTENNLTRDWVNTVSLASRETTCPGRGNNEAPACHMLHYGWDNCKKDEESGTAQCQVDIPKEEVYFHLEQFIDRALGIERVAA